MALKEYRDAIAEPLVLPINGKKYEIPAVSAADGILISELFASLKDGSQDSALAEESELDLYKRVLGSAWDLLLEDGVPFSALYLAGKTALTDFMSGREAAEAYWNAGGNLGEVQAATAAKQPQDHKTKATSKRGTAGASSTSRRGSSSGTKPRSKPSAK